MSLVSIVMPAYNAERYIEKAIQSVIEQTFKDWVLIVIDDASLDNTAEIVQRISTKDLRISFFKNIQNVGVSTTRNRGIDIATGEYIAFLDSDDIWCKNKLEAQLEAIQQNRADICYTSYKVLCAESKIMKTYHVPKQIDYETLLHENVIGCSTVLLKRISLGNKRFSELFFHEDYVLWLQMLEGGATAIGLNDVLTFYRRGGRSNNKCKAAWHRWEVYRRAVKLPLRLSLYYFTCYLCSGIKKHCSH